MLCLQSCLLDLSKPQQHVPVSHRDSVTLSAAPMIPVLTDESCAVRERCSRTWRESAETRISKHLSHPVLLTVLPVPSSELKKRKKKFLTYLSVFDL